MLGPAEKHGKQNYAQLHRAYILVEKSGQSQVHEQVSISNYSKCNKEAIKKFKMENNGEEEGCETTFS